MCEHWSNWTEGYKLHFLKNLFHKLTIKLAVKNASGCLCAWLALSLLMSLADQRRWEIQKFMPVLFAVLLLSFHKGSYVYKAFKLQYKPATTWTGHTCVIVYKRKTCGFACHHTLLHASPFVTILLLQTYSHFSSNSCLYTLSAGHLSFPNDAENISSSCAPRLRCLNNQ